MHQTELKNVLISMALLKEGEPFEARPLAGGVASDVYHVRAGDRDFCVKAALRNLRVKEEWLVSLERSAYECEWLNYVSQNYPKFCPKVIAQDKASHVFAMEYFPEDDYSVWKKSLFAENVDKKIPVAVSDFLVHLHNRSAQDTKLKVLFNSQHLFQEIRVSPYFYFTAKKHPDLKEKIFDIAQKLENTSLALVHGDISPKNILVGQEGPIILDAESAVYGDPAFDLAFLLNHILLKAYVIKNCRHELLECFEEAAKTYLGQIQWENKENFEERLWPILGVLLLARIDGKSPVEYINEEKEKNAIRALAREIILLRKSDLGQITEIVKQVRDYS